RLHRQCCPHQRHTDVLALAAFFTLIQRRTHSSTYHGSSIEVHHGTIKDLWRTAWLGLHGAHPGHGLKHLVIPCLVLQGPSLTKPCQSTIDKAWIDLLQGIVVDAQSGRHARSEVMYQDIGLPDKLKQDIQILLFLQ